MKYNLNNLLFESNIKQISNFLIKEEEKFNPSLNYVILSPLKKQDKDNKKTVLTLAPELIQNISNNDQTKLISLIKDFFEKQDIQTNLTKNILLDFKKNLMQELPDILSKENMKNIDAYKLLPTLKIKKIGDQIINLELNLNYNPNSNEKSFNISGEF
jgi:hypothetical protein